MRPNFSLLLVSIFFTLKCSTQQPPVSLPAPKANYPRNIILMIGDGMALSQVSASVYWQGGLNKSVFKQFPYVGFHKSHSNDDLVTDSAAGATAFGCGQKTNNGEIGMLPNESDCPTILEDWAAAGLGTGIVVTCTATHATPGSFIAHESMRGFTENIALDYLKTPFDCFIGGGEYYFTSKRPDRLDLIDTLKQRGYVIKRGTSFRGLPADGSAPFMLFTAEREPTTASSSRKYLPDAAEFACHYLERRKPKGFFMMIEGSQIDWGGHSNDYNWLSAELKDFEKTIQKVLAYAAQDGETLVIVTGDHECGGLSLNEGDSHKNFKPRFATRIHTGAMVPVFAYGPQAHLFQGIYDNTAIYTKMKAARPRL
jgi:alkaline phosphatase